MKPSDDEPEFPPPPGPEAGPPEYARYLTDALRSALRVSVSDDAVAHIRDHFARFWRDALADLAAYTLLECLETRGPDAPPTEDDILRAVDRVRHRLSREAKRFGGGEIADRAQHAAPPDKALAVVLDEFRTLLEKRDARDAFLFQRHYIENVSPADLAEETGIPVSTVYRRLKAIRDEFIAGRS